MEGRGRERGTRGGGSLSAGAATRAGGAGDSPTGPVLGLGVSSAKRQATRQSALAFLPPKIKNKIKKNVWWG